MTDSIAVFEPGFRIPDTAGNPLPGAVLYFYDAGTSTPKTVYADKGLATALGTTVACDSSGYPSADSARVQIYTGIAPYKIVCKDASGVEQWSHDNVRGATDTSAFLTVAGTTVVYTVTPVTTSGTWTLADVQGHVFEGNPSGGNFTRTLPLAAGCTGIPFDVVHSGSTGIVTLLTQGSDLMLVDGTDTARKALLLTAKGDSVRFISNGVNWRAFFLARGPRVLNFAVEDLRTAPAGSPVVGGYYLINGAPSGAFTATTPACAANDIVMYDGQANYQIFRPFTDCGWTVFDKATNTEYSYQDSAWLSLTTRVAAIVNTAIGFAPVQSVRLGTEAIDAVNLTSHDAARVAGCVMTGAVLTNNTENYYLRAYYRPLQIQVSGSWVTVTSI